MKIRPFFFFAGGGVVFRAAAFFSTFVWTDKALVDWEYNLGKDFGGNLGWGRLRVGLLRFWLLLHFLFLNVVKLGFHGKHSTAFGMGGVTFVGGLGLVTMVENMVAMLPFLAFEPLLVGLALSWAAGLEAVGASLASE